MRIDRHHRTAFRSEQIRRIETAGRKLQHRDDLFPCDVEPFHDLVDGSPGFKVLENGGNRHTGVLKHPCTAYLAGDALHGGILGPIESCHVLYPSVSFYHGSASSSRAGSGPGAPGSRPSVGRFYETAGRVKHFLAIVDTTFKTSPFLVGLLVPVNLRTGEGCCRMLTSR